MVLFYSKSSLLITTRLLDKYSIMIIQNIKISFFIFEEIGSGKPCSQMISTFSKIVLAPVTVSKFNKYRCNLFKTEQ